jgi:hypothetical protein
MFVTNYSVHDTITVFSTDTAMYRRRIRFAAPITLKLA